MTKRIALFAVVSLFAVGAFAPKAAVSAFVTNPAYTSSSYAGDHYSGAWGVGAEYWFTPRVSAAVNYSTEKSYFVTFASADQSAVQSHFTFHPIDALFRYHFRGNERWKPYLGGGIEAIRYVETVPLEPISSARRPWHVSPAIDGGVTFMINRSFGLDFDGKLVIGGNSLLGDNLRASAGLSWRF